MRFESCDDDSRFHFALPLISPPTGRPSARTIFLDIDALPDILSVLVVMPSFTSARPPSSSSTSSSSRKLSTDSNSSGSDVSTYLSAESAVGRHRRANSNQQKQHRPDPPSAKRPPTQNGPPKGREPGREKPPSKDGAAQKAAGEVAGLKDFVCLLFL